MDQQQYQQQQYQQQQYQYAPKQPTNGIGIAALVVGILSLVFMIIPFLGFLSIILAILGVIFGFVGLKKPFGRGMAITGIVTGFIAIGLQIVFWVYVYIIAASFYNSFY